MTPEQYRKASELFLQLRDLSADECSTWLEGVEDSVVREEARSLINANAHCGDFLERSVEVQIVSVPTDPQSVRKSEVGAGSDPHSNLDEETIDQANLSNAVLRRIGRYRLLQQIGEGGHGTVYMAEQTDPISRNVAVKLIKPGMDSKQVLARFQAERQALAMMDHPSIARMIDGGRAENGLPYFVMELVKGIPIDEYCDVNQLVLRERLRLFLQVCNAVHHAHQKGVIHRDIKPSNILVTMGEADPLVKVIDFGIAKALDSRLTNETLFTEFGQLIGTLQYMSPEQAEMSAVDIDTRADVYSLGVLLYQLLTGTTPMTREEIVSQGFYEAPRLIRETEPPTPSLRIAMTRKQQASHAGATCESSPVKYGVNDLKKGGLDWIVMKALEKDRRRRFDSVLDLARDVERFLNGDVVLAHPPSMNYRVNTFVRKNWLAAIVGGLVATSLMVGLIGLGIGLREAKSALKKAKRDRNAAMTARRDLAKNLYSELVQTAWAKANQHDVEHAKSMLEKCDLDLRGWEWHFVNSLATETGHRQLRGRGNSLIACISRSRQENQIACAAENRSIEIRDAGTGQLAATLTDVQANTAAYSVDGETLFVGSVHGELAAYDAASLQIIGSKKLSLGGIYDIVANDQRIALCTGGGWIVVVDTGTMETVAKWNPPSRISRLCFSSQENIIAAGMDGNAYLCSIGDEAIRTEFLSEATLLAVAAGSGRVSILSAGKAISFASPVRDKLNLNVWDSGSTTSAIDINAFGDVAVGCLDGRLFLLSESEEPRPVAKFGNAITAVQATPSANNFLVALADGRVLHVDTSEVKSICIEEDQQVTQFVTVPSQNLVLACLADGHLRAFDASTGKLLREAKVSDSGVWSISTDPNGSVVATVGDDQTLRCWRVSTFELLLEQKFDWGVRDVAVSPDARWLAAAPPLNGDMRQQEGTIAIWRLEDGECEKVLLGHENWVLKMQWSADGRRLVSSGENRDVRVWDVANGKEEALILSERSSAEHIAISDDFQSLLLAHRDGWVTAWDLATNQQTYSIAAFGDALTSLRISRDNRVLTTSRSSSLLRVFQPSESSPVAELDLGHGRILGFDLLRNHNGEDSVVILNEDRILQCAPRH